jgi:hypothetical protein
MIICVDALYFSLVEAKPQSRRLYLFWVRARFTNQGGINGTAQKELIDNDINK